MLDVKLTEKDLFGFLGFCVVFAISMLVWGTLRGNDTLTNGAVALGTIAMAVFVAYQASVMRKSIEETQKERLMGIVVPAVDALLAIKTRIRENIKKLNERDLENLVEITDTLEKAEVRFLDNLVQKSFGTEIYSELETYQFTINSLKRTINELRTTLKNRAEIVTYLSILLQEKLKTEYGLKTEYYVSPQILRHDHKQNHIRLNSDQIFNVIIELVNDAIIEESLPDHPKNYIGAKEIYNKLIEEITSKEETEKKANNYKKMHKLLIDLKSDITALRDYGYEEDNKLIKMIEDVIKKLHEKYISTESS